MEYEIRYVERDKVVEWDEKGHGISGTTILVLQQCVLGIWTDVPTVTETE